MGNANSGARQHRHRKFGDHRHVDGDAVALFKTKTLEHVGELLHLVEKVGVSNGACIAGFAFPVIGNAVANAVGHVAIEAVLGNIQGSADKPLGEWEFPFKGGVEIGVPGEQFTGLAGPEGFVVGVGLAVERIVRSESGGFELWRWREGALFKEVVLDRRFRHCIPLKRWRRVAASTP